MENQRTISGVILFAVIAGALSQTCTEFVEIDPADYDRNYTTVTDNGRPLGFLKAEVPFNVGADQFPCFNINGVQGRHVEIMFETIPQNVLCFRDQDDNQQCGEGRFSSCVPASADDMSVIFYYDVAQGSTESDITFWVRLTKGPPAEEDNEGMWCQWRDPEYPEDLAPLPPIFVPPTPTPDTTDSATNIHMSATLIGLTMLVLGLLFS